MCNQMSTEMIWDEDKPFDLDIHEDLLQQVATGEEYMVDKEDKITIEPVIDIHSHESNTSFLSYLGMDAVEGVLDEMSSVDVIWDENRTSDNGTHVILLEQ